jgi:hypothetical protein
MRELARGQSLEFTNATAHPVIAAETVRTVHLHAFVTAVGATRAAGAIDRSIGAVTGRLTRRTAQLGVAGITQASRNFTRRALPTDVGLCRIK